MRPNVCPDTVMAGIPLRRYSQWLPTLGVWGVSAGLGVLFFFERVPLLRKDIFRNIPFVGEHWKHLLKEQTGDEE
ncbi:hypothetical protein HMI55_006716 [Coelomomyces lativittatus]|nr:hypothetical protein HMI56_006649 [Coelomomyces lativittatus]KAJ1511136.1 hypothetical protein HMI55_006716 [Coelomomyces lativittatus]